MDTQNFFKNYFIDNVNAEEEELDLGSPVLRNEAQRRLWDALPKSFIKKESIQIAMENGIQLRTTAKMSGPQVCTKTTNTLIQRLLY